MARVGPKVMTLLSWRLVGIMIGSHASILLLTLGLFQLLFMQNHAQGLAAVQAQHKSCSQRSSLAFLREAPASALTLTPLNTGPHVVAHTPLHVVAAPYHRLDHSLLLQHALWTADPAVAVVMLREHRVRFVLICSPLVTGEAVRPATLEMALARRSPPTGLREWGQSGDLVLWEVIPRE
jgi:hypothetical protein